MSGKKKKVGTWGGKRPGAGQKPKYMLTEYQVMQMLKRARKREKETGKSIDEILLDVIYLTGKDQIKDKLAAIKLFKDYTIVKSTEKDININVSQGPVIGLPEMRPDPAKEIQPPEERLH